ncbi:MAG: hypothetical protein ACXV3V_02235 [Actinomycetes bacterium]
MTGPDDDALAALLRARLDDELAAVSPDRRVLADVLSRPVRRRSRKGWAAVVAAGTAAGAAVAVAVVGLPSPDRDASVQLGGPSPSAVPTSPASTPAAIPSTTPSASSPTCPPQTSDPGGPVVRIDLDGDGVPDSLTYNGGAFHVVLGAGRGEVSSAFSTASSYLTALSVSTAGTTRRQVLIGMRGQISAAGSVGGVARLYDLRGCAFAPVLGVNGKPYDFLVGNVSETERSGVVCEADVLYGRTAVLRGGVWHVTDRPVTSAGATAVNGAPRTSTVAAGTPEADALATETCGGNPQSLG